MRAADHRENKDYEWGPDFCEDLIALLPNLRAFAISLAGNAAEADDLVQETLIQAWNYREQFKEETNLRAWTFTILVGTGLAVRSGAFF